MKLFVASYDIYRYTFYAIYRYITFCDNAMGQKQIESQLISHLLASGADKMWSLEDVRDLTEIADGVPVKRTIERWISAIPWLKSSHQAKDQLDELNRPANQLVLGSLVTEARKKRKAALFVQRHELPPVKNEKPSQKSNCSIVGTLPAG